jgi:general secretion pathway protein A
MTDALARGDAIIVLTGESGTGKTTLWRRVVESLPRPVLMSVVDSSLGFEDLMHRVLTDFHTAPPPGTRGIADLSGYDLVLMLGRVLASLPTGARAILVVDDAQSMKPSVVAQLRSLTNLETRGAQFQIILVGRPALQTLLKRPETRQLQQRVGQWCKLTPLTGPEIQAYVDHRLSVAGRRPGVTARPPGVTARPPGAAVRPPGAAARLAAPAARPPAPIAARWTPCWPPPGPRP